MMQRSILAFAHATPLPEAREQRFARLEATEARKRDLAEALGLSWPRPQVKRGRGGFLCFGPFIKTYPYPPEFSLELFNTYPYPFGPLGELFG